MYKIPCLYLIMNVFIKIKCNQINIIKDFSKIT